MKIDEFFALHKVFTVQEFISCLGFTSKKSSTLYNLLAYHQKQGHILHLRRGLYYSVPKGVDPNNCPIDPFLIASKLAEDAVLAYRTALDIYGKLHSIESEFIYLSKKRVMAPFVFRELKYQAAAIPTALKGSDIMFGVESLHRMGQKILVTNLERTVVDVLDRPHLSG